MVGRIICCCQAPACSEFCTFFIDANARVGSIVSEAVGDVHPDEESPNGALFHAWLLRLRLCALSTFRCKGHGGTWRSSVGQLRRIDYVCGSQYLLAVEFDVVVAR